MINIPTKQDVVSAILGLGFWAAIGLGVYHYTSRDQAPQSVQERVEETGERVIDGLSYVQGVSLGVTTVEQCVLYAGISEEHSPKDENGKPLLTWRHPQTAKVRVPMLTLEEICDHTVFEKDCESRDRRRLYFVLGEEAHHQASALNQPGQLIWVYYDSFREENPRVLGRWDRIKYQFDHMRDVRYQGGYGNNRWESVFLPHHSLKWITNESVWEIQERLYAQQLPPIPLQQARGVYSGGPEEYYDGRYAGLIDCEWVERVIELHRTGNYKKKGGRETSHCLGFDPKTFTTPDGLEDGFAYGDSLRSMRLPFSLEAQTEGFVHAVMPSPARGSR